MPFRITGFDPAPFRHLYGLPDVELARFRAERHVADAKPGFPDRVELRDAEPGERLLLLNYTDKPARRRTGPSHAIFVREGAERAYDSTDTIPEPLRLRLMSLRAFDADHQMIEAELAGGSAVAGVIEQLLARREVGYIQTHYAKRGCYAARVERP